MEGNLSAESEKVNVIRLVCAEMTYSSGRNGEGWCDVHSDICPPGHSKEGLDSSEYREFVHRCLDEWLNRSNGTGYFLIGDSEKRVVKSTEEE